MGIGLENADKERLRVVSSKRWLISDGIWE